MILDILNEINSDNSRLFKISVIKTHQNNELLKTVMSMALSPFIRFHIKKIPQYVAAGCQSLEWALQELGKLSSRQLTGTVGVNHLQNILSSVSTDDAIVIERIIGKDLRIGAADGVINEAIPDLIEIYPCLLARPYTDKNADNIIYEAASQLKSDGRRVNFHIDNETVFSCGRSGLETNLQGALDADLIELGSKFNYPVMIDGELVVVDHNGKIMSRKAGNGIITKIDSFESVSSKLSGKKLETYRAEIADYVSRVRTQVWDVVPLDEFKIGRSTRTYRTRLQDLTDAIAKCTNTKIMLIETRFVKNLAEAVVHFKEKLAEGSEGTILKNLDDSFWEDSRSKNLVKMKDIKSTDLKIVSFNEGKGKFVGQVGSLICESSDGKVRVDISGFTDAVRRHLTDNIEKYIGTIVEIEYNERISSKNANREDVDSLFSPRFSCFRTDKFVADDSSLIL